MGTVPSCDGCDSQGCDTACGRGEGAPLPAPPFGDEHEPVDEKSECAVTVSDAVSKGPSPQKKDVPKAAAAMEEPEPDRWKPLVFNVVGARNLRNADVSLIPFMKNLSDPYCIVSIEGKPLSRSMTDVVKDNLDPIWNHAAQFSDFEPGDTISFKIFDKDNNTFKNDDFLGSVAVPSSAFHPKGFDGELLLSEAGPKRKAYIHIKIEPAILIPPPPKPVKVVEEKLPAENGAAKPAPEVKKNVNPYKLMTAKSGNANAPSAYVWLESSLKQLAANQASAITCTGENKAPLTPVLFVFGGCPNAMCGMQAVMFAVSDKEKIEFWWVKASKDNPKVVEPETLCLQEKGTHKNSPGRSGAFYQPLADLFQQGCKVKGWTFGLKKVTVKDKATSRAVIFKTASPDKDVCYVTCLWQEDFTMNPFARSKYIKGKIVYQKNVDSEEYFARQYEIHDGSAFIADYEEGPDKTVMPTLTIKNLWDMGVP